MDRRTLLALLMTAIVIVITPILFPAPRRPQTVPVDSVAARVDSVARDTAVPRVVAPPPPPQATVSAAPQPLQQVEAIDSTVVRTERAVYTISSRGAAPVAVELPAFRSLRPGNTSERPVSLLEPGERLFSMLLVGSRDTVRLDTMPFRAGPQRVEGDLLVQPFTSVSATPRVDLDYRFQRDSFVVTVDGRVTGDTTPRRLQITLPTRIRSEEADPVEDTRMLAVAFKRGATEVENISFDDLDTLVARVDTGSVQWVAERNKYFVVAIAPVGNDSLFRSIVTMGGPRRGPQPTAVLAAANLPLSDSEFSLRVYAGPQSWDHLRKTAPELENVNPVGGWFHGLVQPFATIVMRMLLWMRDTFQVGYGWVLVIFGVLVRILLWPLNQSAMRSSLRMQRLQPQLQEIQKKYREHPEKQRDAMMKLYQEHGMSPFTPILGCLPMLLPMPILFALYFVFQNTIELRGVSFLWLPDLSLKDPLYITPLFMGVTMFLLSWIGMRGMPPSPQTKMMSYVMPVMFTVIFWNFASGLNLYYAVQNVAALPQQWLIARERSGAQKTASTTSKTTPAPARLAAKRE